MMEEESTLASSPLPVGKVTLAKLLSSFDVLIVCHLHLSFGSRAWRLTSLSESTGTH